MCAYIYFYIVLIGKFYRFSSLQLSNNIINRIANGLIKYNFFYKTNNFICFKNNNKIIKIII